MTVITSIDQTMTWGKHKGKSINHIIHNHTQYAEWLFNDRSLISVSQPVRQVLSNWKHLAR